MMIAILVLIGLAVISLALSVKVIRQYQRGVIFRLGRIHKTKPPGLRFIIPIVDWMVRVDIRTRTLDIKPQDMITRDNVTVRVNAVAFFNVTDAVKSVIAVEDFKFATGQIAQTTLRSIVGQVELDDLLTNREDINSRLQQTIGAMTDPWGVQVTLVEVKDVELPESMRRAMARQAESERERRAKVIHARGEREAATELGEAAAVLETHPAAMQLRVLATMAEVAVENNSTLIFPLPLEVLRWMDAHTERA
jgi:regulator of protease activity HflC (stomatin/prohibitin superfamily)